ncbi:MAG TPA: DMT family transporter [Isosphaeraceae bacterium]|jgi:drug/metabolite transporter (DMT)-like permease|nr:DMT family transporter [Isosphaeraceae bacterium]
MSDDGDGGTGDSSSSRQWVAWAWLLAMVVIGSTTATAARVAVRGVPAGLMPPLRFGLAGLCLLPVVGRETLRKLWRSDRARLLAAAALCVPINQTFFLHGTRFAPTTHVALIYAAVPLVVLALAWLSGQERPSRGRLLGIAATVAGIVVIGLGHLWRREPTAPDAPLGDLLEVGAVLAWGGYIAVNKPLVVRHGALPVLVATFLLGALIDLPIAAASWPSRAVLRGIPAASWWALAYLTVVSTTIVLTCQNLALRHFDASQVAAVNNVSPLLTIGWGVLLLGEALTSTLLIGGALTLLGVAWSGRARAGVPCRPGGASDILAGSRPEGVAPEGVGQRWTTAAGSPST